MTARMEATSPWVCDRSGYEFEYPRMGALVVELEGDFAIFWPFWREHSIMSRLQDICLGMHPLGLDNSQADELYYRVKGVVDCD